MNGKLFVIEGVDGSGKATQTQRLYQLLQQQGRRVKQITFPNYDSPSSSLVKMYLNGEFGTSVDSVNAYVASTFYAVDRFASYKTDWQAFYQEDGIIIADRYTTSNMIHQGSKITDPQEKTAYLQWLMHFEYELFQLPKPTCTIFLDMPPAYSLALRTKRQTLATDLQQDIHEQDLDYLMASYFNAKEIAALNHWTIIPCVEQDTILSIEAIQKKIFAKIQQYL